jgi:hypothetical protein
MLAICHNIPRHLLGDAAAEAVQYQAKSNDVPAYGDL